LLCSPQFVAPAYYIIGVYGRTQAEYLMVVVVAPDTIVDALEGVTYSGRLLPQSPTTPACKYYGYGRV
jgi:hypothetical protein